MSMLKIFTIGFVVLIDACSLNHSGFKQETISLSQWLLNHRGAEFLRQQQLASNHMSEQPKGFATWEPGRSSLFEILDAPADHGWIPKYILVSPSITLKQLCDEVAVATADRGILDRTVTVVSKKNEPSK